MRVELFDFDNRGGGFIIDHILESRDFDLAE